MITETISPLNRAHLCGRQAERFTQKRDFENALKCHNEAAALLQCAFSLTTSEKALVSLQLQREFHLRQKDILKVKAKEGPRLKPEESIKEVGGKERQYCPPRQDVPGMNKPFSGDESFVQVPKEPSDQDSNGDKTVKLLLNYIRKQQIQIISLSEKLRESEAENRQLHKRIEELRQSNTDF